MNVFQDIPTRVITDIENGILPPGTPLSQRKFGQIYGCGRGVARRILKDLLAEGYIDIAGCDLDGGYAVAAYTEHTLVQSIELRAVLETYAVQAILKDVSPALVHTLKKINKEIRQYAEQGDLVNAVLMNRHFHLFMIEAVDQGPLSRMLGVLFRDAAVDRHESYEDTEEAYISACEHAAIIDAIEMGDHDRLGMLMENHVLRGFRHNGRPLYPREH